MTARYTRAEFAEAGLEPGPCDGAEVKRDAAGRRILSYWFACDYHEGYIDGYEAGARDNR